MRHIFTSLLLFIFFISNAQDGIVDVSPTFGTNGKQITPTPGVIFRDIGKIRVISGGKILQCFSMLNGSGNYDFALARYNNDGSLDAAFGTSGIVTTDFGPNNDDAATSLTVNPVNGKITVVGYSRTGGISGNGVFAIARYNSDGTLDNTFNGTGKVTTAIGTDAAAYFVLQNSGITEVGGYSYNGTSYDFALTRYNDNGTLDNTFNGTGKVTTTIGTIVSKILSLTVQNDGKVVAAGYTTYDGSTFSIAVARYNINGTLDNGFGTNGIVTTSINGTDDEAYDVIIQPVASTTGKIIAVGTTYKGGNYDFGLVQYNSDGSLDNSFGVGGKVSTAIGSNNDIAYAVSLQSNGKILAAGISNNGVNNNNFAIARYDMSGNLDVNFGGNATGYNTIDFNGRDDYGYGMAFQGSNIILGGISNTAFLDLVRLVNSTVTLPVSISYFSATKQNNSVALNWQTQTEQNTSSFEIQKSNDGNNFIKIGKVQATGSSSGVRNYSFIDMQPQGINFYRLKILSPNGAIAYSKIVVIRFNDKSSIVIFPNPVRNTLNLQLTQPAGQITIQINDVSGRLVKRFELKSDGTTISTSIDMNNFQRGIYFIKINDETLKIVKD